MIDCPRCHAGVELDVFDGRPAFRCSRCRQPYVSLSHIEQVRQMIVNAWRGVTRWLSKQG